MVVDVDVDVFGNAATHAVAGLEGSWAGTRRLTVKSIFPPLSYLYGLMVVQV